jgi:hypothetical protein
VTPLVLLLGLLPIPWQHLPGETLTAKLVGHLTIKAGVYARIVAAPKMECELLGVTAYQNKVVYRMRVANRAKTDVEVGVFAASAYARSVRLWDEEGSEWREQDQDDHFKAWPHAKLPKVVFPAGRSVTFEACSPITTGALVRAYPDAKNENHRPKVFRFTYSGWASAYEVDDTRDGVNIYRLGTGQVSITWTDRDAPSWVGSWCVRLEPPAALPAVAGGWTVTANWHLKPGKE